MVTIPRALGYLNYLKRFLTTNYEKVTSLHLLLIKMLILPLKLSIAFANYSILIELNLGHVCKIADMPFSSDRALAFEEPLFSKAIQTYLGAFSIIALVSLPILSPTLQTLLRQFYDLNFDELHQKIH